MQHADIVNFRHKFISNSSTDFTPDEAVSNLLLLLQNDLSLIDADNGRLVEMKLTVNPNLHGYHVARYILVYQTKNF